jgi:hypothetical protein
MKKIFVVAMMLLVYTIIICRIMTTSVLADENYNDISNEYSDGPREPPED